MREWDQQRQKTMTEIYDKSNQKNNRENHSQAELA